MGVNSIALQLEQAVGEPLAAKWFVEGVGEPDKPLWSGIQAFSFAPPEPGSYQVTAQIMKGDDDDEEDDECPPVTVTVEIFRAKPMSVSFGGANHLIRSDPRPGVASFEYTAPHWKDDDLDGAITPPPQGADRRYPVAYTRGATVTITEFVPVLTMDERSNPPATIYYKATVPDGEKSTIGQTGDATAITAPDPLDNTIAYDPNYSLTWEISFDGQHVWYDIGSTSHEMYVTLDTPVGQRYETMYHIATTTGHGVDDPDIALERIWDLFETRSVPNKSGETMGYYRGVLCSNSFPVTTAAELIAQANGQCNAWVEFFRECLGIHAIGSSRYEAVLVHLGGQRCQQLHDAAFLVNNHQFTTQTTGCLTYPYLYNHPCPGVVTNAGPAVFAQWLTPGVMDMPGTAGQDSADPASVFANHFIVRVGINKWYDPSYGTPPWTGNELSAAVTWTATSVAGFIGVVDNDIVDGVPVLFLRARQRVSDLVEIQFVER